MTGEATGTFQRALGLLERIVAAELSTSGPPVGARLAASLEIDPAQASRMLKELRELGLVELDEEGTRGYRAGPAYFRLAAAASYGDLVARARPALRQLVVELHEPAWLSVLVDGDALTVAAERNHWSTYAAAVPGRRSPAWCSGAGRALLLDASEAELDVLFADGSFVNGGPHAVRALPELVARIAADRPTGMVIADDEFEYGVLELAAPVRDAAGRIVGAIGVAAPHHRLDPRRVPAAELVRRSAAALVGG